jgi:hypothetical protein
LNKDKIANVMASTGSMMRRENERLLAEHIEKYLGEAKEYIRDAEVIFLHAPGLNKSYFVFESKPLQEYDKKIRNIEFKSKNANYTEAMDLVKKIC